MSRPRRVAGYLAAIGGEAVSWILRIAFDPLLDTRFAYLFFVPAIVAAAALSGLRAGLLATLLGLAGALSIPFLHQGLNPGEYLSAAVFVALGTSIALVGERNLVLGQRAQRAYETISAREVLLRSVLDTVPDAIILIDDAGIIRSFSRAAELQFGWSSREVVGKNVSMLMPAPYRDSHDGYIARYLKTGEPRIIGIGRVVVGLRRGGATFPMELAVGEMTVGARRYFTGFVRDLSERQQTETRLQELQAELVHVARLTSMGEMASSLAHELNQPLSAIANYLNGCRRLLGNTPIPKDLIEETLRKAKDQALRAGEVIRRLRDFVARGETERRTESLHKLLEEASALALVGGKEQGIRVSMAFDPSVDSVHVDKVQVQQVVLNLIRNAIEAMEASPRRELSLTVKPAHGPSAEIVIADTGAGLAPEIAPHLFQPFITTKRTGLGVGLSISRTIVEAHGGRIWVETSAGEGTAFHFTLPVTDGNEVEYE
ncbi:MAG: PAS domain S-box protein [Alphaproteobacteria bacterium]|nr:PAS domain S-box protein [Alphaproteobacteria bacterium]